MSVNHYFCGTLARGLCQSLGGFARRPWAGGMGGLWPDSANDQPLSDAVQNSNHLDLKVGTSEVLWPWVGEARKHTDSYSTATQTENDMGKYVLGWILGVPVIVLVIIYLIFN